MLESAIALNSSKIPRLSLASTKEKHSRADVQGGPVTRPGFTLPSASTVRSPWQSQFFGHFSLTFFFLWTCEVQPSESTTNFDIKRILLCWATVKQKQFVWFLKLSMRDKLLQINKNVGDKVKRLKFQFKHLSLTKVNGWKNGLDCLVHIVETLAQGTRSQTQRKFCS